MAFANPLLSLIIAINVLQIEVACDAPYDYTEGFKGTGDVKFVDCMFDVKGITAVQIHANPVFTVSYAGSVITYIEVTNQKPKNERATIYKSEGGILRDYVSFYMISAKGHGFLFHILMYGKPAPGKTEPPLTGKCNA